MDRAKSPVLVLIVLVIVSLIFLGGTFFLLQKEKNRSQTLQEELDDVKTRQRITETKLDDSKKMLSEMESKLKSAQDQITSLSAELQQEKAAKQESVAQLAQLKQDLDEQKTLRSDLENKFTQSQQDAQKMQAQLNELDAKKKELEIKIKDLESKTSGVELGKIVVSPEASAASVPQVTTKETAKEKAKKQAASKKSSKQAAAAPDAINVPAQVAETGSEGKVLVLNKEYDFAVINLGSKDGINVGDLFSAYHNNNYIGDLKIEKLHDSMAAAGFVTPDVKDKISEGDKIVKKK